MFNVCFVFEFNFNYFFGLGADEVFTGQRYADAIYGRPKVDDDGTACHRGEGKAIINGCTDWSKEISLQNRCIKILFLIVIRNNNMLKFNNNNSKKIRQKCECKDAKGCVMC